MEKGDIEIIKQAIKDIEHWRGYGYVKGDDIDNAVKLIKETINKQNKITMKDYKLVIEFMDWGPIVNDEFKDSDNWATCVSSVKNWHYIKQVISQMKAMVCGLSDKSEIIHLIKNIDKADLDCDLDGTFDAVVELIKWFNKESDSKKDQPPSVDADYFVYIRCPHCTNCEEQPMDQQRHHLQSLVMIEWEDENVSKHQCLECDGFFNVNW